MPLPATFADVDLLDIEPAISPAERRRRRQVVAVAFARLAPCLRPDGSTTPLSESEVARLHEISRDTVRRWTAEAAAAVGEWDEAEPLRSLLP